MAGRVRFDGWIPGVGTGSRTRVVVGHWPRSPFGSFCDVMVQRAGGHRLLLAPTRQVAGHGRTGAREVIRPHRTGRW